jgi:hypothetical protein
MHTKQKRSRVGVLIKSLAGRKRAWTVWVGLFVTAFAFGVPISTVADTVSGHVYGADGKAASNVTFTAKPAKGDAVEFKTDAAGNFSVFLDPGRYTVTAGGDSSVQGLLNSFPQPVQQDVHLKKEGK